MRFLIILMMLTSCGKNGKWLGFNPEEPTQGPPGQNGINGENGKDGSSCSAQQLSNGSKITCTDGTFSYIYNGVDGQNGLNGINGLDGVNGLDGANGANGLDGMSCSVSTTSYGALIMCQDGTSSTIYNGQDGLDGSNGSNGLDGINGQNGTNGINGQDGQGCSVTQLSNGISVTCGNSTGLVYDGNDTPPTAYTVIEIIDPCGDELGAYDEVLLKMSNNEIIAHRFEKNSKQFMTILQPGNHKTSDSQECEFTVNNNGSVTW